jgi:hypothetical protein
MLELVEAVDLDWHPSLYNLNACLKSLTWMATRLSISIPPLESALIERLYRIYENYASKHCLNTPNK